MKKILFFIILGVVGFSLLASLVSRFSGVWLGVEIFVMLTLFLVVGMTRTERLDNDSASSIPEESESSTSSPPSSRPDWWAWGGLIIVILTVICGSLYIYHKGPSEDKKIRAAGWREVPTVPYSCFYNGKRVAVTGIPLPPEMAGKAVVFRRFRWSASFALENGRCRLHFTSPGVEEAVKLDKSNYPLLLSINGRVPDTIWWRPLDLVTRP